MSSLPTGTGTGPGAGTGAGNGTDPGPDAVDDSPASAGRRRRGHGRGASGVAGWPFVVPFLVFFVLFLVVPIGFGLWMSFTDSSLTGHGDTAFAGLGNYTEAFTDSEVWQSLGNTAWFTVLSSVPLVLFALVMALLVHTGLPGQWVWRLSFFAPYLLPVAVVTQVWNLLYQPESGMFNTVLKAVGIDGIGWLVEERYAMWSVAILTLWWTVGFNFLLYLAALQSVPDHLYEAAALDGAGAWRRLWSITLPQLRRTTGLIAVLQVLASLKVFDQIYLLTKGGPAGSTRPILEYIYDTGFTNYRLGYASAVSYVFFAIVLVLSLAQLKLFSRRED
ncbi:carbohydrate ABC transporter permease [Streptomyces niveus]|uniref:carbohydrate ABC transporter permease n=1 Tax=Streptomyces niveus TaxID=193462 RepID=UPI0036502DC5